MNHSSEITGSVVKSQTKIGDTIYLSVPMKEGDVLVINGWKVELPIEIQNKIK